MLVFLVQYTFCQLEDVLHPVVDNSSYFGNLESNWAARTVEEHTFPMKYTFPQLGLA